MERAQSADHLLSFEHLVNLIGQAHAELTAEASRAVNTSLTLRNWLIGFHIVEYEQRGTDRAQYGDKLVEMLSDRLIEAGVNRTEARELRRYRRFYLTYPQIRESVSPELTSHFLRLRASDEIRESVTPVLGGRHLLTNLSFTHFVELIAIHDPLKRAFYETECLRGYWSVRELKRQIASHYYERSGLSWDKQRLSDISQKGAEKVSQALAIRDPYVFEFLGLKSQEVMGESDLEDQLLDKLQDFLLELGHGFCFEARQKRVLIGNTHNFVDLVFYHRILKCHVLLELKVAAFSHENIGQLNTYVSWYRKNVMTEGDNPPIGILLCTQKDQALVEYALAGMDIGLFVSKYLLELPKKEAIERFIRKQMSTENN